MDIENDPDNCEFQALRQHNHSIYLVAWSLGNHPSESSGILANPMESGGMLGNPRESS